jgi:hypothetical protein
VLRFPAPCPAGLASMSPTRMNRKPRGPSRATSCRYLHVSTPAGGSSCNDGCGCVPRRWESPSLPCAFPHRAVGFVIHTVRFSRHTFASPQRRFALGDIELRLPSSEDRTAFPRRLIDRSSRRLTCSVVRLSHSHRHVGSPTPPIGSSSCTIVSSCRTILDHVVHDARYTPPDRLTTARIALMTSALRLISDAHALIMWRDRVIDACDALIGRSLLRVRAAASSPRAAASSHRATASAHHAVASPRREVGLVAPTGCGLQRRYIATDK